MKHKILVVDDEPHNLEIIRIFLNSLQYEIHEADCGMEMLKKIEETSFDLILLDVMMPDISGFDIIRKLQERQNFDIPIIFLSAKAQKEDILQGLQLGAVDYLTKPFDLDLLEKKIEIVLQNRSKYQSLQKDNSNLTVMAYIDALTGLYNRAYLNKIKDEINAGNLEIHSVMMIDVDFLKMINDVHGHLVGDQVLEQVAEAIFSNIDQSMDYAFRIGGDEFIVFRKEKDEINMQLLADLIRTSIAAIRIGEIIGVSVSIGFVSVEGEQLEEALKRVDVALYQDKNRSRKEISY